MLPAALRGELGTFPTSAAGLPAAPLRSAPPLSPRGLSSPAAPRTHRAPGAAGSPPGCAPLAASGAEERNEAKPGAAVPRRAPPHAATAPPSPAPTPRSPARTRGEDPSAHGRPLPSHCSRPPLARRESPLPFAAHTHTRARTHRALLGGEGDAAPGKRSRSRSRTLGGAAPPLPFPERTPRSSRGSGAAGGALRGGESGGAPLPGRTPRGCHGAAAATSAVPGTAATGPSRPPPHSAGVRAAAEKRKGRKGTPLPSRPSPAFLAAAPLPRLETKVEVETEWAGW